MFSSPFEFRKAIVKRFCATVVVFFSFMRIYLQKSSFSQTERRPVPWNVGDAAVVVFFFLFLPGLLFLCYHSISESSRPDFLSISTLPGDENPDASISTLPGDENPDASTSNLPDDEKSDASTSNLSDVVPRLDRQNSESDFGAAPPSSEAVENERNLSKEHPLTELLIRAQETNLYFFVLLSSFLTAVVIAPIAEEFVFRVVLQGAFERFIFATAEESPFVRRLVRTLAIGVPAFLFATIHYRSPNQERNLDFLLISLLVSAISNILIVLLGWIGLSKICGANREDFGFVSLRTLPSELLNGLLAFFMILPLLILVRIPLVLLFPRCVTDPIPIFVLAVGLGLLFYRTHRFASVVAMHAALNLSSFLMILLI